MANNNRYRGSESSNYGSREEDRDRYSRKDYNQYDSDYGSEEYGQNNRRTRRYDEDWDEYNNRTSNQGNRSQGSNYGSNYGSSYGTSQNNRDYDSNRYGNSGSSYGYGSSNYNSGKNYGSGTSYGNSGAGSYGYGQEYNRNRGYGEDYNEDYGTGNYGSGYGRRYDRDRDYNDRNRQNRNRDWWDKTKDEVSSWFGDEDAERRRRQDKVINHRGRGPKGYTRSDERIKEDVNDRLSDDAFLDASEIEVMVSNGEVTLSGTVENRIDKRRAEDLAEDISGVSNVQNQLRVKQTTTTNASGLKNEYQG
jgi:osmotically-inducible protein OsmY